MSMWFNNFHHSRDISSHRRRAIRHKCQLSDKDFFLLLVGFPFPISVSIPSVALHLLLGHCVLIHMKYFPLMAIRISKTMIIHPAMALELPVNCSPSFCCFPYHCIHLLATFNVDADQHLSTFFASEISFLIKVWKNGSIKRME